MFIPPLKHASPLKETDDSSDMLTDVVLLVIPGAETSENIRISPFWLENGTVLLLVCPGHLILVCVCPGCFPG